MSSELATTFTTVLGTVVGGAISAYATIRVAQIQARAANEASRPSTQDEATTNKGPKKRTWIGVALIAGVVSVISIVATIYNVSRIQAQQKELAKANRKLSATAQVIAKDNTFASIAAKKGRPYVVNSIVSNVEIEDSKQRDGKWQRNAYVKTVYTLDILKDIIDGNYIDEEENKAAFVEKYGTNEFKRFRPWFGTEVQDLTVPGTTERNEFKLVFSAKKGSTYTVVTGGTYTYALPLSPDLPAPYLPGLRVNEDFYLYRNDEDYVKSLIIFIHSKTTNLSVTHRAAYRVEGEQPRHSEAQFAQDNEIKQADQRSISARFTYLKPNMHGGILYKWSPQR